MPQFDFASLAIGGVALAWLINRIVEALKLLGLSGTRNIVIVVLCVGFFLSGVAASISEGLIPEAGLPYIRVIVIAVAGAVAAVGAIGEHEIQKKLRAKPD